MFHETMHFKEGDIQQNHPFGGMGVSYNYPILGGTMISQNAS